MGLVVARGIFCLASMVAAIAGAHFLMASLSSERARAVADYDRSVDAWTDRGRREFEGLTFTVSASMVEPRAGAGVANASLAAAVVPMNATTSETRGFASDADSGAGIHAYEPLSYAAQIPLSGRPPGHVDAPFALASRVQFRFKAWKPSGDVGAAPVAAGAFETPPLPLRYLVLPPTPAGERGLGVARESREGGALAQRNCEQHEGGVWQDGHCWLLRVLSHVCVQVGIAEGNWTPQSLPGSAAVREKRTMTMHEGRAFPSASAGLRHPETSLRAKSKAAAPHFGAFGCDPRSAWDVAVYRTCGWSRPPLNGAPDTPLSWKGAHVPLKRAAGVVEAMERAPLYAIFGGAACHLESSIEHVVEVAIRSAEDPYLRAEWLTQGRFDFGYGVETLRGLGFALLAVGCILSLALLAPCILTGPNAGDPELELELTEPLRAGTVNAPRTREDRPNEMRSTALRGNGTPGHLGLEGASALTALRWPTPGAPWSPAEEDLARLRTEARRPRPGVELVPDGLARGGQGGGQTLVRRPEDTQPVVHRVSLFEQALQISARIDNNTTTMTYRRPTTPGPEETCIVCMDPYTEGDVLRALPCLHRYHAQCVDRWLAQSVFCPECRHPLA